MPSIDAELQERFVAEWEKPIPISSVNPLVLVLAATLADQALREPSLSSEARSKLTAVVSDVTTLLQRAGKAACLEVLELGGFI